MSRVRQAGIEPAETTRAAWVTARGATIAQQAQSGAYHGRSHRGGLAEEETREARAKPLFRV